MMENSAQPGEGRGCAPTPLTLSTIYHEQSCVVHVQYATAEWADTLPLFLLYPYLYSVGRGPLLSLEREREGKGPERRKIDRLLAK
jgi:hypothetical protein